MGEGTCGFVPVSIDKEVIARFRCDQRSVFKIQFHGCDDVAVQRIQSCSGGGECPGIERGVRRKRQRSAVGFEGDKRGLRILSSVNLKVPEVGFTGIRVMVLEDSLIELNGRGIVKGDVVRPHSYSVKFLAVAVKNDGARGTVRNHAGGTDGEVAVENAPAGAGGIR